MDVSKHAIIRYAERIKGKDNKTDVAIYIENQEDNIKESICKMVEYGELIYTGRSTSEYNKSIVEVYLKDSWVIIVDLNRQNVITLYSIDLGVGKEFNEQYMSLMLDKLIQARDESKKKKEELEQQKNEYDQNIQSNNDVIVDCRKTIKALEEQNEYYENLKKSLVVNGELAEKDIRDTVATLIGRKVF